MAIALALLMWCMLHSTINATSKTTYGAPDSEPRVLRSAAHPLYETGTFVRLRLLGSTGRQTEYGSSVRVFDQETLEEVGFYTVGGDGALHEYDIIVSGLVPNHRYMFAVDWAPEEEASASRHIEENVYATSHMMLLYKTQESAGAERETSFGYASGGSRVVVRGAASFDREGAYSVTFRDRWGNEVVTNDVNILTSSIIRIVAPEWPFVASDVALILQDLTDPGAVTEIRPIFTRFEYLPSWRLAEFDGAIAANGGEEFVVRGHGFGGTESNIAGSSPTITHGDSTGMYNSGYDYHGSSSYMQGSGADMYSGDSTAIHNSGYDYLGSPSNMQGNGDAMYSSGELHGSANYECRLTSDSSFVHDFPATVVSSLELICTTEPLYFAASEGGMLSILHMGTEIYMESTANNIISTYATLTSVENPYVRASGGIVRVEGMGFDPENAHLQCEYHDVERGIIVASEPVAPNDFQSADCVFMPWVQPATVVEMSVLNLATQTKMKFWPVGDFEISNTPVTIQPIVIRTSPASTLATGGIITVNGYGFDPARAYQCLFRDPLHDFEAMSTLASALSADTIKCLVPDWHSPAATADVYVLDGDVSIEALQATPRVAFAPVWLSKSLQSAGAHGGARVSFFGFGFDTSDPATTPSPYTCAFQCPMGNAASRSVEVHSSSELVCETPMIEFAAQECTVHLVSPTGGLINGPNSCIDDDARVASSGIDVASCVEGVSMGLCEALPWEALAICPVACGLGCGLHISASSTSTFFFYETWEASSHSRVDAAGGDRVIISGYGFNANREYTCALHGRRRNGKEEIVVSTASLLSARAIACVLPVWNVAAQNVLLEINANDESVANVDVSSSVEISIYASWSAINKDSVDARGGTRLVFSGNGFDVESGYTCRFFSVSNDHLQESELEVQSSTKMRLQSSIWTGGESTIFISLFTAEGVELESDVDNTVSIFASWDTYSLKSGNAAGFEEIHFSGHGFSVAEQYECVFRGGENVIASSIAESTSSTNSLHCTTPTWHHAAGVASISLRRPRLGTEVVAHVSNSDFRFFASWHYKGASEGGAHGNEMIEILGHGFDPSRSDFNCVFTGALHGHVEISAPATPISFERLVCITPEWQSAADTCTISVVSGGEIVFVDNDIDSSFQFYETVTSISVHSGNAAGGDRVAIIGNGFDITSGDYFCAFVDLDGNSAESEPVVPNSPTSLSCITPVWLSGETAVTFSLRKGPDLIRFLGEENHFTYIASWHQLSPSSGFAEGGELVSISGNGFRSDELYSCVFTGLEAERHEVWSDHVYPESSTRLSCTTPTWYSAATRTSVSLVRNRPDQEAVWAVAEQIFYEFVVLWSAMSIDNADAAGGSAQVVAGNGFARDAGRVYTCRFVHPSGAYQDSAPVSPESSTSLTCIIPKWLLSETKEAQMLLLEREKEVAQRIPPMPFHFWASWYARSPDVIDCRGGETIVITGDGFDTTADDYTLSFSALSTAFQATVRSVNARPLSSETIEFTTPTWLHPEARVTIAVLREESSGNPFYDRNDRAIFAHADTVLQYRSSWFEQSDDVADAAGGLRLTIRGYGFDDVEASSYTCTFTDNDGNVAESAPTMATSTVSLTCVVPTWYYAASKTVVGLHRNKIPVHCNNDANVMDMLASWSMHAPKRIDARGGDAIHVVGNGFDITSTDYTCFFGVQDSRLMESSAVKPYSSTELECSAPTWFHAEGTVPFSLLRGGATIATNTIDTDVVIFASWEYKNVEAGVADAKGGDVWTVSGNGFDSSAMEYVCIFTDERGNHATSSVVTPVSSTILQCVQPWWYFAATPGMALSLLRGAGNVILSHDFVTFEVEPSWSSMGINEGDAHGGDVLSVHGAGFDVGSGDYFCRFMDGFGNVVESNDTAPATSTTILCITPWWTFPATSTSMTLIKRSFGEIASHGVTTFVFGESWRAIGANIGDVTGGAALPIYGAGFDLEGAYVCEFRDVNGGHVQSTAARSAESSTDLKCVTPAWTSRPGYVVVGIGHIESGSMSVRMLPVRTGYVPENLFLGGLYGVATAPDSEQTLLCYLNRVTERVEIVSSRDDLQYISRGSSTSLDAHIYFAQHQPSADKATLVKLSLDAGNIEWRSELPGFAAELLEGVTTDATVAVLVRTQSSDRALYSIDTLTGSILRTASVSIPSTHAVLSGVSTLSNTGTLYFVTRDLYTASFSLIGVHLSTSFRDGAKVQQTTTTLPVSSVLGLSFAAQRLAVLSKSPATGAVCLLTPDGGADCSQSVTDVGSGVSQAALLGDLGITDALHALFLWPSSSAQVVSISASDLGNTQQRSTAFALDLSDLQRNFDRRLSNFARAIGVNTSQTNKTVSTNSVSDIATVKHRRRATAISEYSDPSTSWRFQLLGYHAASASNVAVRRFASCADIVACYECLSSYEISKEWASSCVALDGGGCAAQAYANALGLRPSSSCLLAYETHHTAPFTEY